MIPKIIHYVWFGGKKYPPKIQKCIESWHRILPDYEFIKWDESNFDINSVKFTKQAFDKGQWAFVSDFVRVQALLTYGGWYLDTDVELLKPLCPFEVNRVVFGTDENGSLTAVYGTEPNNDIWQSVRDEYLKIDFIREDGTLNQKVINQYIQDVITGMGYIHDNKFQKLGNGILIFPDEFFHVASLEKGTMHLTENSVSIHWQTMTWTPKASRFLRFVRLKILKPLFGNKILERYNKIACMIKNER